MLRGRNCPDSADIALELERLELCLPPYRPPDERRIAVELSEVFLIDIDTFLTRVEGMREAAVEALGVPFDGLRFLCGYLADGSYRVSSTTLK